MTESALAGRNVLIAGATGAFARSLALACAAAGADLALTTATPDAEAAFDLRRIARSVGEQGRRCLVEGVDLSLGTSVQVTVRQVAKALGGIDVLVAAPDLRLVKPAERLTDADWARVFGVNLSGVYYLCRGVAREMLGREPAGGRIVLVTAQDVEGESAAYVATKAAVAALAVALDDEWASRGLRVGLVELAAFEDESAVATAVEAVMAFATS